MQNLGTSGSSPHTRGTRRCRCHRAAARRLIPAHAGNSAQKCSEVPPKSAHPRTRGELAHILDISVLPPGSSPHTRGTPSVWVSSPRSCRLIPAHAGNSLKGSRSLRRPPAHPRTRGELGALRSRYQAAAGSSPHTRGTRAKPVTLVTVKRLIPAHAGNSREQGCAAAQITAHPRTRGELMIRGRVCSFARGSSPHTRGTLARNLGLQAQERLIPAHAGNSPISQHVFDWRSAHPRTRGELK